MNDPVIHVLSVALDNADMADVNNDTYVEDLPDMDSLAHLRMITELEKVRGQPLAMEELIGLETVGDIRKILEA